MNMLTTYVESLSLIDWILGGTLLFFFLIQLFFYLFFYRKPAAYEKKRKETPVPTEELPGISVIITSKNNSEELEKNLPFILEQDYPLLKWSW